MNILLYIYTLVSLVVLDTVWLLSTGAWYRQSLSHLFADKFNFVPAAVFYLLYAAGVVFFVVLPAAKGGTSFLVTFLSGAFLGLLAYAAYDLTNHATLRAWPVSVTIVDMLWGAFVTGLAGLIAVTLYRFFNK